MSIDPDRRARSNGAAQLLTDVVRDLRSDARVQEQLAEPGGFSPREQIATPLTAPSESAGSDDLPPALVVVDAYRTSSGHRRSATDIDYEVEVGLTVTRGWVEYWSPNYEPRQVGTNPDLKLKAITDAISERAHRMFDIPNLTLDDGGSGGSMNSPRPGGERAIVNSWLFSRTRG